MIRFSNLNQTIHSLATKAEQTNRHRFAVLLCDSIGQVIASSVEGLHANNDSIRKVSAISGSIFTEYTAVENLIGEGLISARIRTDRHVIFIFRIGSQGDPLRCILLVVYPVMQHVTCIDEFMAIANSIHERILADVTPLLVAQ